MFLTDSDNNARCPRGVALIFEHKARENTIMGGSVPAGNIKDQNMIQIDKRCTTRFRMC